MLGIIRCRTLKCKRNLPKRDRFILVGFIWGNVGARRKGRASVRHVGASWIFCGIPCGQKMANMSTVASVVSYRSYKIIDTTVNMFINVGTQKHATGHFDQFEGISRGGARRRGVRASRGPSLQVPMLLLLETAPLDYLVHYLPGAPPERAAPPLCRGRPVRGLGEALGGRGLGEHALLGPLSLGLLALL